MSKKKIEKVRRYQAARTRLPGIMLTTVDRANLDICIMRHGTTVGAVIAAISYLRWSAGYSGDYGAGSVTGEKLQSIFMRNDDAADYLELLRMYGSGPYVLRQALHEYAMHITKSPK